MIWENEVQLTYQTYLRQHEDADFRINEVVARLDETSLGLSGRITYSEATDTVWPIEAKGVEPARAKGYFLTERDDVMCVVVRRIVITVMFEKSGEDAEIVDELNDAMPLTRFSLVQVIKSLRTEMFAE